MTQVEVGRGFDPRQLRLVNGTIHEKIGQPISVSMLSSVAGLSRSYFSHVFRASVGRTPHAHIVRTQNRTRDAADDRNDEPLSEIALAAGFSDQAHFSNKFRHVTGMTPTRWRRARRRDQVTAFPPGSVIVPNDDPRRAPNLKGGTVSL
jgi:AraC-like DNA-binding protein